MGRYLTLGDLRYNIASSTDHTLVVSSIISSPRYPTRPSLVSNISELDRQFGIIQERSYFKELLDSGVQLYLTAPMSSTTSADITEGLVDLSTFSVYPELLYSTPPDPIEGLIYKIADSNGAENDVETGFSYDTFIYHLGSLIKTAELPQSLGSLSESLSCRDSLRVNRPGSAVGYVYPRFDIDTGSEVSHYNIESEISGNLDLQRLNEGKDTLSYFITYDRPEKTSSNSQYILLHSTSGSRVLLWFDYGEGFPNISEEYFDEAILGTGNILTYLKALLVTLGWKIYSEDSKTLRIYSPVQVPMDYFYNIQGLEVVSDQRLNQDIICSVTRSDGLFEVFAKGCGTEVDRKINFSLQEGSGREVIAEISLGDYVETFIASSLLDLENRIWKESNLVEFRSLVDTVPQGSWDLSGASPELVTNLDWLGTLESMFGPDNSVFPDFHLVPDPVSYGKLSEELFKAISQAVSSSSCQVLIVNRGDLDCQWNYLDPENNLVYFFRDLDIFGNSRPGYYLHLKYLLQGINSAVDREVQYDQPETDFYGEEPEPLVGLLEKYRSNYLSYNNHQYYYKGYLMGKDDTTSVWLRFCLGKVRRELEKSRWSFVSCRTEDELSRLVNLVLQGIVDMYPIFRSIQVSGLSVNWEKRLVDLSIKTEISDLVKSDISLNITINFN